MQHGANSERLSTLLRMRGQAAGSQSKHRKVKVFDGEGQTSTSTISGCKPADNELGWSSQGCSLNSATSGTRNPNPVCNLTQTIATSYTQQPDNIRDKRIQNSSPFSAVVHKYCSKVIVRTHADINLRVGFQKMKVIRKNTSHNS